MCTVGLLHGNVVGYKDTTTASGLAVMSALGQQPVSIVIQADQSLKQERCDPNNARTVFFSNDTCASGHQAVSIAVVADQLYKTGGTTATCGSVLFPIALDRCDHSNE